MVRMEQDPLDHIYILMARKLSGEASDADLEALSAWLHNHPEGHYAMEIIQDFWKHKPVFATSQNSDKQLETILEKINSGKISAGDESLLSFSNAGNPKNLFKKAGKSIIMASLIGLIAFSGFIIFKKNKPAAKADQKWNEISTRNGAKSELILPDGTKVWLNAGSTLTYDKNFGEKFRKVNLSGEAFFDVVKDAYKPFLIKTRNMQIKVMGTAFNVKCYPGEDQTETSLVRGKIEVMLNGREESIVLRPNEKLVIDEHPSVVASTENNLASSLLSISRLTPFNPKDSIFPEISWIENKLTFRNETLLSIANTMERWFGVTIRIVDEQLKTKKFTGIFTKETAAEALKALQLVSPFTLQQTNDTFFLSNTGKN
jgi:transmembrane sensor